MHTQQIEHVLASGRVLLAPMAGVTDAPFRGICKRMGAALTYTEMISAKGLHYNPDSRISRALLSFSPDETPCAVQIFGSDAEMMAEQASRLADEHAEKIAAVDINMGCPVSKVVAKGEGSALMRDRHRAASIVARVAARCPLPVTVKIRAGWSAAETNAAEFARAMESAGARAIAVHGRTREQFYKGAADWDVILAVKQAVSVPVIGSGDVFSATDVVRMLAETGADAVMVARGAQGNPWIFREARSLLAGAPIARPTGAERIAMAREHGRALEAFAGPESAVRMRKHLAWYLAEMPGASHARSRVNACASFEQFEELLDEYERFLAERPYTADGAARA
jgi:nifR3 family TIM-barrel protein